MSHLMRNLSIYMLSPVVTMSYFYFYIYFYKSCLLFVYEHIKAIKVLFSAWDSITVRQMGHLFIRSFGFVAYRL